MEVVPRSAAAPAPGGVPDAEARLALLDELLALDEARACAERTLAWTSRHAGVDAGLCLAVDAKGERLAGLAGWRLPAAEVEAFSLALEERAHPLVVALGSREPVPFDRPARDGRRPLPATPLGGVPFTTASLGAAEDGEDYRLGLLIVSASPREGLDEEALGWAARLLGTRLSALWHLRGRAEELRRSREVEWLSGILEVVTDPILLTDSAGRILIASRAADHLLSADDSMGSGRRRAVALNNMLFSASLFTNAEKGGPSRRELPLVDPVEGQDLLFELITSPFPLGDGETGLVSILRNITDLSRAAAELEENYRRLRAAEAQTRSERDQLDVILNAVLDPILVTDTSGDIVMMNPPAEHLFTVGAGAAGGEAERRVQVNDAVFSTFAANLHTGRSLSWRQELTLTDPASGRQIPMEAVSAKTRGRPAAETAVVTILHDQSEAVEKARLYEQVKRHSEELQEKVREATRELADQNELLRHQALQLEQASTMKSQFLANVSHELRTPLHAIVGYTELLLEGVAGELGAAQREKLERVDSNANHLLTIINDVLDLSRIESGKIPVRVETFTLEELFDEVRAEAESLIEESELAVSFEVEPEMPELVTDRQKVKQILINLLSNALKFTAEGSVSIRGVWRADSERVAIAVRDTGPGISEEHRKAIFEPFGQSEAPDVQGKIGTGLGLSICRRLAALLGGEIRLRSRPGEGATFTLVLPPRRDGE